MKLIVPFLLVFFLALPMVSAQTVEYTPTTKTICDSGTCTKELYSGRMFVFEDSIWKPIEQAASLKGVYEEIYLENDPDFLLNIIDYNYTTMSFNLTFTGNYSEYEYEVEENKTKVKLKFTYNSTEHEIEMEVETETAHEEVIFKYDGNPLAFDFSFGGNSTTIELRDNNTENLEDTYVNETNSTFNYGSIENLELRPLNNIAGTNHRSDVYIKFNISSIPSGSEVTEALLYTRIAYPVAAGDVEFRHVYNQTWEEGKITWDNQPCDINITNSTNCNLTRETVFTWSGGGSAGSGINHTITNMVKKDVDDGNSNFSVVINGSFSTYITGSAFNIKAKEHGTVARRPALFVTYFSGSIPLWQTNQSSTTATYNPIQSFDFNITWNTTTPAGANISWVFIETNLTGTATNYTVTNTTYGDPIYNWTTTQSFSPAQYYWKSWANTTEGIWNETDTFLFTVAQNASNPLTLNFTIGGSTTTNAGISTISATTVSIDGGTDFENSGSVTVFVNTTQLTLPDSSTYGVGVYDVKINTSGNANYTSNGTGVTYTMTVTSGITTGGGGGGGASPFTVIVSDACNVTIIPRTILGLSGSSTPGSIIAPFTILLLNKNVTQTFTAEISGEVDLYCDVRFSVIEPIPPFGSQRFIVDCTAPNGTASGNLVISSDLGCTFGVPITVSLSVGIFADISNVIKLFVSGELVAAFTSTILNVPVWLWLIVIFGLIVLFLILR